jgi:hypothetical protein
MKQLRALFIVFLVWRIILFAIPFVTAQFLPYRHDFEYTHIDYFSANKLSEPWHTLLTPWANFDGVHYLAIAGRGYVTEARFFPLWPMLIDAASLHASPFSLPQILVALTLSHLLFLFALSLLYLLFKEEKKDKYFFSTALVLIFFPTSFFFVSVFTEGLFLCLALSALLCARKGKWLAASGCAALLMLTRIVGIFILPALVIELLYQQKVLSFTTVKSDLSTLWLAVKKGWSLFFTPIGLILFSAFNAEKWGSALYFLKAHGELGNNRSVSTLVTPVHALVRYGKILTSLSTAQYEWWVALAEVSTFILFFVLLVVAWKKKVRPSYLVFAWLCFLLPTFSGTFTGLPRYVLILFPAFMVLGEVKNMWVKRGYVVVALFLTILCVAAFSRGYFIS